MGASQEAARYAASLPMLLCHGQGENSKDGERAGEEADEEGRDVVEVYYVLEGPPVGVMTEEEQRKSEQDETLCRGYILKSEQDETLCRGYILSTLTDRLKKLMHTSEDFTLDQIQKHLRIEEETRIREKNLNGASSSKVNYVDSGKNNKGNNKKRKGTWNPSKDNKKDKKPLSEELHMASVTTTDDWWYDSGATIHVYNNRDLFKTYKKTKDGHGVMMCDNHTSKVIGSGNMEIQFTSEKKLTLMNVLHVPNIRKNLVSGFKLCKSRVKAVIEWDKVIMSKANVFIGKAYACDGMFKLNINKTTSSAYLPDCNFISSFNIECSTFNLWHNRLRHINYRTVKDMLKQGIISYNGEHKDKCEICVQAKMKRKPFPKVDRQSKIAPRRSERARKERNLNPDFIDSQAIIFLVEGDNENNVVNKIPVLLNVDDAPKTYKEVPKQLGVDGYLELNTIHPFKLLKLARITSIRVLFALASIYNLPIHQMNVKTAFLNGDLDEEVYMKQPEGFVLPGHENKVLKLKKSLYGLKQAPKKCHDKFDKSILSNGFTHNLSDRCIYSKFTKDYGVIICLYVDDILIVGTNMEGINETKKFLSLCFQIKDMNEVDTILGIKVKRHSGDYPLNQCHYIDKIIDKFQHLNIEEANTPYESSCKLVENNGRAVAQIEYASAIGVVIVNLQLVGFLHLVVGLFVGDQRNKHGKYMPKKTEDNSNNGRRIDKMSYVNVVNGDTKSTEACEPALLLDESCLNQLDYSLGLLGKVKEFTSFDNMRMVLGNKGFNDIDLRYMGGMWIMIGFKTEDTKAKFQSCLGATSWFSQIIQASKEFVIDERITWVDIEGIPLKLWSERKRFSVRAKETTGWIPDFDEQEEDNSESEDEQSVGFIKEDFDGSDVEKKGDNNVSMVPDSVKEDVNVQAEEKGGGANDAGVLEDEDFDCYDEYEDQVYYVPRRKRSTL
nr:zinc finger, CCHC-type [Tanacetum cinerariifolium]